MHLLPLDRRTIFSRNVFCGATSPLLPPAMVILPTARGLGASRRGSSGQQQAGRGARAQSRLEVPHAPHGDPGGQGRRLPPAATLRLPPSRPLRASLPAAGLAVHSRGLASPQPPAGGRGEPRRLGRRRPLPGACPARACGRPSRGPAAAGRPRAAVGPKVAAPPSGQMAFGMLLGRFLGGLTPSKVTVSLGMVGWNASFAPFQAGASGTSEALGTPSCFPLGILSLICESRPTLILKLVVN